MASTSIPAGSSGSTGATEVNWLDWLQGQLNQEGSWLGRANKRDLDSLDNASFGTKSEFMGQLMESKGEGLLLVAEDDRFVRVFHHASMVRNEGTGDLNLVGASGLRRTMMFKVISARARVKDIREPEAKLAPALSAFAGAEIKGEFMATKGHGGALLPAHKDGQDGYIWRMRIPPRSPIYGSNKVRRSDSQFGTNAKLQQAQTTR